MGAKYLPTIKDQKLGQRFQRTQLTQSKFMKPAVAPAKKTLVAKTPPAPKSA